MASSRSSSELLPTVVEWGQPIFAVSEGNGRKIYFPDGMKLEVALPDLNVVLVETIRVVHGSAQHQFSNREVTIVSEWKKSRVAAFMQCVQIVCKRWNLPSPKRAVIFGPSHPSIQEGILRHFGEEVLLSVKKKKSVTWGDEGAVTVEGPEPGHKYGGWGLETFHTIPNRFEIRALMGEEEDFSDGDDYDELMDSYEGEEEYFIEEAQTLAVPTEDESFDMVSQESAQPTLFVPFASKKTAKRLRKDEDELTLYPSSDDDEDSAILEEDEVSYEQEVKRQCMEEPSTLNGDLVEDTSTSPPPVPLKEELTVVLEPSSVEDELSHVEREWANLSHSVEEVSPL